jgi:hypothetical protein
MSEPFDREQRNRAVLRVQETREQAFKPSDPARPEPPLLVARALDTYHAAVAEYSDRLPRVLMSACPFTGAPLVRAFDPFGLDGPWWHAVRTFDPEEPSAPPSFRTLLGALDLRGRVPAEATSTVLAGPGAPFVVPSLLELPGMVAVMHRVELATGDVGYPVGYFSLEDLDTADLHQFWTRQDLWFKTEDGDPAWTMKNYTWDFDLQPWIEKGQLRWLTMEGARPRVVGHEQGGRCPYAGLDGVRRAQIVARGRVSLKDPPDGSEPEPFA